MLQRWGMHAAEGGRGVRARVPDTMDKSSHPQLTSDTLSECSASATTGLGVTRPSSEAHVQSRTVLSKEPVASILPLRACENLAA